MNKKFYLIFGIILIILVASLFQLKHQVVKLEKKLISSEKKVHQEKINRVLEIRKQIYPNGKLQERSSNFSEFYINEGANFIDIVKNNLDPLNQKFSIIEI